MRAARLGKKFPPLSEEAKAKISKAHKGKKFSDQHKAHLSEARKRRQTSEETRYKCSQTSKGRINIKRYLVADPNGILYTTDSGLTQFCREHNLHRSLMQRSISGPSYKGWKVLGECDDRNYPERS